MSGKGSSEDTVKLLALPVCRLSTVIRAVVRPGFTGKKRASAPFPDQSSRMALAGAGPSR